MAKPLAIGWADLDALVTQSPRGPKPWNLEELAILDRYYPTYGPHAVVMALKQRGYKRTRQAVMEKANQRGLRYR